MGLATDVVVNQRFAIAIVHAVVETEARHLSVRLGGTSRVLAEAIDAVGQPVEIDLPAVWLAEL